MKFQHLTVLYVGDISPGGTCLQRMHALQDLGMDITCIHTRPPSVQKKERTLHARIRRKILGPRDWIKVNQQILTQLYEKKFDILWLDKALCVHKKTLLDLRDKQPNCRIIGYSPDDMLNKYNQSWEFLQSLPYYDLYITTKSFGVAELQSLGCKNVEFVGNAYDPHTHKPMEVTASIRKKWGGKAGFIGQWELEREESLWYLAESGVDVRIWGYTWERCKRSSAKWQLENRPLWGTNYASAICSFDINLCFLRKCNRDVQTQRSVEIPACGGFMLAERTKEHLELFEEGIEAEFFADNEEMIDKASYYIVHQKERDKIARLGRQRCLKSKYSNADRIASVLSNRESLLLFY